MTKIKFMTNDDIFNDWKFGDIGHIDGYLSNNGKPYIVIINYSTGQPVLVPFSEKHFQIINL